MPLIPKRVQQERFPRAVYRGNYVFHIHTSHTDGYNTVNEYCDFAHRAGIRCLMFLEHVRSVCDYDVFQFLQEIDQAQDQYRHMDIFSGVEASLLPEGQLGLPQKILKHIDVLGIAVHDFSEDSKSLQSSLCLAMEHYSPLFPATVLVHPTTFFNKNREIDSTRQVILKANCVGVWVEQNKKHHNQEVFDLIAHYAYNVIIGMDAHSIEDIRRRYED